MTIFVKITEALLKNEKNPVKNILTGICQRYHNGRSTEFEFPHFTAAAPRQNAETQVKV